MSDRFLPLDRLRFEVEQVVAEHPPLWRHRNKEIVHGIACPPQFAYSGRLEYSRWAARAFPDIVDTAAAAARMIDRPGYYDYDPVTEPTGALEWHVNFADPRLFVAYGSRLFAQDEMQVAEHPVLGSLKEALDARQRRALTEEDGKPTPVLVTGVPRLCRVATDPNAAEGRPHGLYGNAFARAVPEAVRRATTRIDPSTITNLIAMAAPAGGFGPYRTEEVEFVLITAFTAFRAAVRESARIRGSDGPTVVHTGFWGCGAFGGNRVLMTTLQTIAAQMAEVDRIVFHTGEPSGAASIREARRLLQEVPLGGSTLAIGELVARIVAVGLEWGVSDGN